MKEVIGVRFRTNGRVYFFDPRDNEVSLGTKVIVETSRGVEYGWVVLGRREVDEEKVQGGLRPIQRLATPQDEARYESNKEKSRKAYEICVQKIKDHDLNMKLVSAEYAFDNNKIMFYFTADNRVDFRELVKDLASVFRTRIELRQIGVRDEAKMCGGIGICGREFCCHAYLADFVPVSIKMAKEQSLSLNPTKISGACGRLMCCLKNEQDTYEYLNSKLPNVGDRVTAYDGVTGDVASLNVLRQKVKIYVTDEEGNKELVEYRVEELVSGPRGRKFDTDESLLDPELTRLVDNGEAAEEGAPEGGRRRKERSADGEFGRGGRGGRSNRDHNGGKDRKEGAPKDRGDRKQERDGSGKGHQDGEKKNRHRQDGGRKDGNRKGEQGAKPGKDQGAPQGGNQAPKFHRRNNRPNRKPEDKKQ